MINSNFSTQLKALKAVALVAAGVFSASAQALVMPADTFLFSTFSKNSGPVEAQALRDFLGNQSLVLESQIQNTASAPVAKANGANGFYIDIAPNVTSYFVLKFGVGNTGLQDTYYFSNASDLTKLVWTNAQVNLLSGGCITFTGCNIEKLSHYVTSALTNGGSGSNGTKLPEPGSVLLIGLGLIGLIYSRKASK